MKKEDILNFIRLLDASERLMDDHEKSDRSQEKCRQHHKSLQHANFVERCSVHVFNLQQKVRELEANLEDSSMSDEIFFEYSRRIQVLETKLAQEVMKSNEEIKVLAEKDDINNNSYKENAENSEKDRDEYDNDHEEEEEEEEFSSDESVGPINTSGSIAHHINPSSAQSHNETSVDSYNESILKQEEVNLTNDSISSTEIRSSLSSNKIGIEEKRKQLEASEEEKESLLSELVNMAAALKGEASSISTHLKDQNEQLAKLTDIAEATSDQLGGEVTNLNKHFRRQIVSICGGITHMIAIVIIFFVVTMFMRVFPRRFSILL